MATSLPEAPVVIFLDFDGVLHAVGEAALDDYGRLIPNSTLFCWRPLLEQLLEPHPSVKIVVASDWRCHFDDQNLARLLGPALGPRMIGIVEDYGESRAIEIVDEANRRGIERWLSLDDHASVALARQAGEERFIVCHPETGLSALDVQRELRESLAELCGSPRPASPATPARRKRKPTGKTRE